METAEVKFNGGNLAWLCKSCDVIMKTGEEFTIPEKRLYKEGKLPAKECLKCQGLGELDFRSISRNSDYLRCQVMVRDRNSWRVLLEAGESGLITENRPAVLQSHLGRGATDSEHDSAYAFSIGLIGVTFTSMVNHVAEFEAYVDPSSSDGFRVPHAAYNPFLGAPQCKVKGCKHPIVPYMPDINHELWESIRGARLRINTGPNWDKLDV